MTTISICIPPIMAIMPSHRYRKSRLANEEKVAIQRALLNGPECTTDGAVAPLERSSAPAAAAPSVTSMGCRSLAMCFSCTVPEERNHFKVRLGRRPVNGYDGPV